MENAAVSDVTGLVVAQLLVNGILFGTMYGIAAIGLSLIFGTMRLVFIAQGALIVFFAYICFWLSTLFNLDPYLSLAIIVPLGLVLGIAFYYVIFKEAAALEDKNVSFLLAVGLMFLTENLMTVIWTANPRTVVTAYASQVLRPGGLNIPLTQSIALLLAIIGTLLVYVFLKRTLVGIAVRAAAEDMVSVTLMGIDPNIVSAAAFAVGIGLAGLAGVGLATVYSFDPMYGFTFALKALIALALGGIGNVFGALVGGIALGFIESFGSYFVAGWTDAIAFGVFLLVLMLLPEGIFGKSIKKA